MGHGVCVGEGERRLGMNLHIWFLCSMSVALSDTQVYQDNLCAARLNAPSHEILVNACVVCYDAGSR